MRELRYSDGAAHRRINAMRLLKEIPQVERKLSEGTISLSTVSQLQDFIQAEKKRGVRQASAQKLELLESISGKSTRETQAFLAARSPESVIRERVRPISEEQVLVHIGLSKDTLKKLDELKALLAHSLGDVTGYGTLITKLADRVLKEEKKKREAPALLRLALLPPETLNRHPGAALKRAVWQRAASSCEYVDPRTQRRCTSTFALEIDHRIAWTHGGKTTLTNLQLLCSTHHRSKTSAEFHTLALPRASRQVG